jgi:hypothetical protein
LIATAGATAIIAGGSTAAFAGGSTIRNTQSTKRSTSPVAKQACCKRGVNLRVENLGPRNLLVVICHPGGCKPERTLRPFEVEDMSASEVSGHFSFEGRLGTARFTGVNPDIGRPEVSVDAFGPHYGLLTWKLSEGERTGCHDLYIGGRAYGERDSDIPDYKRLWLKVGSTRCGR